MLPNPTRDQRLPLNGDIRTVIINCGDKRSARSETSTFRKRNKPKQAALYGAVKCLFQNKTDTQKKNLRCFTEKKTPGT